MKHEARGLSGFEYGCLLVLSTLGAILSLIGLSVLWDVWSPMLRGFVVSASAVSVAVGVSLMISTRHLSWVPSVPKVGRQRDTANQNSQNTDD